MCLSFLWINDVCKNKKGGWHFRLFRKVFFPNEGKKKRKGLSLSAHVRTRKMVIYAYIKARSEETLMEALV